MRCDWLEMPAGGRCELEQGHEGPHVDAEAVWRGFTRDTLEAERLRADAAEARAARLAGVLTLAVECQTGKHNHGGRPPWRNPCRWVEVARAALADVPGEG